VDVTYPVETEQVEEVTGVELVFLLVVEVDL